MPNQMPSAFEALAPEIRLNVYSHIFPIPSKRPLRRLNPLVDQGPPIDTAVFALNRNIHTECITEFYSSYIFHIELDSYNKNANIPKSHLALVKYASADITHLSDRHSDNVIAGHVQILNKHCPSLKTFTLHLLHRRTSPDYQKSEGQWLRKSAKELQILHARVERLTIVTVMEGLTWLRAQINRDSDAWAVERLREWPRLNLTKSQVINVYHLYWPASPFHNDDEDKICAVFHVYQPNMVQRLKEGGSLGPGDWIFA